MTRRPPTVSVVIWPLWGHNRHAQRRGARTSRRRGTATALIATLATVVSGCGSSYSRADGPETKAIRSSSVAVDYASFYAPIKDIRHLATAHAAKRGAKLTFSDDAAGAAAQSTSLRRYTGPAGGFGVVVVAPFDPAAVGALTAGAKSRGVRLVSYLTPIKGASAAIGVDLKAGANALAREAFKTIHSRAHVLLIVPPTNSPVPDPLGAAGTAAGKELRTMVRTIGLTLDAEVPALGDADARAATKAAFAAHPKINVIFTWNDATAVGASRVTPDDRFVGAFAPGGVASASSLRALHQGGALKAIVAPRLSDLADALVDVPFDLLHGKPPAETDVPLQVFTKGAAATRAALADYR